MLARRAWRSAHGPEGHLACLGTTDVGLDQESCAGTAAGRGERRRQSPPDRVRWRSVLSTLPRISLRQPGAPGSGEPEPGPGRALQTRFANVWNHFHPQVAPVNDR